MKEIPVIQRQLDLLEELCERYPKNIPLPKAAEYLGITAESMRKGVAKGAFPFAVSWSNDRYVGKGKNMTAVEGRAVLVIPTTVFYFYITGRVVKNTVSEVMEA